MKNKTINVSIIRPDGRVDGHKVRPYSRTNRLTLGVEDKHFTLVVEEDDNDDTRENMVLISHGRTCIP
ncbi:MAG: hypothetical protein J5529_06045 [Prevotella sp.]|nr:hypothetical protein [Prevotella sp.]